MRGFQRRLFFDSRRKSNTERQHRMSQSPEEPLHQRASSSMSIHRIRHRSGGQPTRGSLRRPVCSQMNDRGGLLHSPTRSEELLLPQGLRESNPLLRPSSPLAVVRNKRASLVAGGRDAASSGSNHHHHPEVFRQLAAAAAAPASPQHQGKFHQPSRSRRGSRTSRCGEAMGDGGSPPPGGSTPASKPVIINDFDIDRLPPPSPPCTCGKILDLSPTRPKPYFSGELHFGG